MATATADTKTFTPMAFVYTGRRWQNGKLYVAIAPMTGERRNAAEKHDLYEVSKTTRALTKMPVGAVCTGAEFSDTSVRGLSAAKYQGMYDGDHGQTEQDARAVRATWQALDQQAAVLQRAAAMARDAKAVNEIENMLLPLRKQYHGAAMRGDYTTMEALKAAVIRALHKAPKD